MGAKSLGALKAEIDRFLVSQGIKGVGRIQGSEDD